jgi:hypothetical protein
MRSPSYVFRAAFGQPRNHRRDSVKRSGPTLR